MMTGHTFTDGNGEESMFSWGLNVSDIQYVSAAVLSNAVCLTHTDSAKGVQSAWVYFSLNSYKTTEITFWLA